MGLTSAQRHAARELGALLDGNPFTDAAFVLLAESGCTIRQWRERNSGIAHCSSPAWEITVPRPRTALSFGVFAHEVGHQMLHRSSSLPRYVEEVQAWEFALDAAKRLNVDETPHERVCRSLRFAFKKALRAGVSASRLYANDDVRWWAVEVDVYALAESLTATANP